MEFCSHVKVKRRSRVSKINLYVYGWSSWSYLCLEKPLDLRCADGGQT